MKTDVLGGAWMCVLGGLWGGCVFGRGSVGDGERGIWPHYQGLSVLPPPPQTLPPMQCNAIG